MDICPISNEYNFTFTGTRADDGGQPEELIATVIRRGADGTFGVNPYDTRVDNEFTFEGHVNGGYNFLLTGGVSGVVMSVEFVVNHEAKRSVAQLVKDDVHSMMCGECNQGEEYVLAKALLESSNALISCGENLLLKDALDKIDLVLKGECGSKLCQGGC